MTFSGVFSALPPCGIVFAKVANTPKNVVVCFVRRTLLSLSSRMQCSSLFYQVAHSGFLQTHPTTTLHDLASICNQRLICALSILSIPQSDTRRLCMQYWECVSEFGPFLMCSHVTLIWTLPVPRCMDNIG